jgi:hypothetical protein
MTNLPDRIWVVSQEDNGFGTWVDRTVDPTDQLYLRADLPSREELSTMIDVWLCKTDDTPALIEELADAILARIVGFK